MSARGGLKRKRKEAEDWRSTLFFWRGVLSGETWQGTWVGAPPPTADSPALPPPLPAAHAASANTFSATLSPAAPPAPLTLASLLGLCCSAASTYQLDQGDGQGLQSFADAQHALRVADAPRGEAPCALAAACGENNFGSFVSAGLLTVEDGHATLTLARRYVREGDARARWRGGEGARAALQRFQQCEGAEGAGGEPAWLALLPWRVEGEGRKQGKA